MTTVLRGLGGMGRRSQGHLVKFAKSKFSCIGNFRMALMNLNPRPSTTVSAVLPICQDPSTQCYSHWGQRGSYLVGTLRVF